MFCISTAMRVVLASVFSFFVQFDSDARAADGQCAANSQTWEEFSSLIWEEVSGQKGFPVVYALVSPTCPWSRRLYNEYIEGKFKLNIRFVPVQAENDLVKRGVHELVKGGQVNVMRQILNNYIDKSQGDDLLKWNVASIVRGSEEALHFRFSKFVKKWGTPVIFYRTGKTISVFAGYPDLKVLESRLRASVDRSENDYFHESTIHLFAKRLTVDKSVKVKAASLVEGAPLRLLPDARAMPVFCIPKGAVLEFDGSIDNSGERWLVYGSGDNVYRLGLFGNIGDFKVQ